MDYPEEFQKLLNICQGDFEHALITCHLESGTIKELLEIAVSELKDMIQNED